MRYYFAMLVAVVLLVVPWFAFTYPDQFQPVLSFLQSAEDQLASVILAHNPKTVAQIQSHYSAAIPAAHKVRILIVPGHEPDFGGAEYIDPKYGHVYERNMTVELGQDLEQYLNNDGHYETFITRDTNSWSPEFNDYFKNDWNNIVAWQAANKQEFSEMIAAGLTTLPLAPVDHAAAPGNVAMRLYGITKWANENNIDIEIHIHFNDYPGHGESKPGKYSGFTVYVPVAQYQNGTTTHRIADGVFKRLQRYNPVSDLPGESVGVVDDPELIALGASNTADAASMLIEYSYIYEPVIDNPATRSEAIKDLAYQTYLGLEDFFDPAAAAGLARAYDTVALPYTWKNPISTTGASGPDVFAMQTALLRDGDYPPSGKTMSDCPRSGSLKSCTKTALQTFQKKYGISGEDGVAGEKTIEQLNRLYSVQSI